MVHPRHLWGAVLTLSAALASIASAESVTVTQTGVSEYRIFDTSIDGGKSYHRTLAGVLQWKNNDKHGEAFDTFCIELTQKVGYGKYKYNVTSLENDLLSDKADLIRELWGRHRDDVVNKDTSAAFQLAVWEIVYDDVLNGDGTLDLHKSLDLKDGSFRVKGAIDSQSYYTTAQEWLWELDGTGPMAHLMAMSNDRYQDQVVAVPLPAAVWTGMASLLAVATVKARKSLVRA